MPKHINLSSLLLLDLIITKKLRLKHLGLNLVQDIMAQLPVTPAAITLGSKEATTCSSHNNEPIDEQINL